MSFDLCGINHLNDGVGINMFPLRRLRMILLMASICPLLACAIMSFRCFPDSLHRCKGKVNADFLFNAWEFFRRFLVPPFDSVEVPECKAMLPQCCYFFLDILLYGVACVKS